VLLANFLDSDQKIQDASSSSLAGKRNKSMTERMFRRAPEKSHILVEQDAAKFGKTARFRNVVSADRSSAGRLFAWQFEKPDP
jgi:hypothetical protein